VTTPAHHPDVVDVLAACHRGLLDLLDRAAAADPGPVRADLVRSAADSVRRHTVAEERHVHPVLRRVLDDADRCVQADVEEHEQLERLLLELEATGPDGPGTAELLRGLVAAARRHVETVERWRLPVLRSMLTETELTELADRVSGLPHTEPRSPAEPQPHGEPQPT
jgi:hypothetical protein